MQSLRDLEPDGHAAARQRQHDHVVTVRVRFQRVRQLTSCFNPIFETHVW